MIPKETVEQIIETARIEEVVGDYVSLKKRGANLIGLCPFHNEKTPSFTVSPAKGIYKCFGCGEAGNSVNFVMGQEHMSYPDALRHLAKKYNIHIEEEQLSPEETIRETERESLFIVSQFAQKHFTHNLLDTDEGKSVGLSYFRERGFSSGTIDKFQLGYAIDSYEDLLNIAKEKGYQLELLEKTGLLKKREERWFDFFRARVIFPIHNITGKVIGFGARTLKTDKKEPKYLNSPETEIYNKSAILYGIFFAKKSIIGKDNCYLVEGYTDVISMVQAGIENVVASSGTSLTTGQIRLIKRYTNNITILYDGDTAGIKASFRGIDMILEEGMNVRVLLFPDGEDPDSYSKRVSTEEYHQFIADNTKDFILFKTDILLAEAKNDPVKKATLIRELVASVALVPDAITRSVYTKECAKLFEIPEQTLINELNKFRRTKHSKESGADFPSTETALRTEIPLIQQEELNEFEPKEVEIVRDLLRFGDREIEFEIAVEELDSQGKSVLQKEILQTTVAEFIIFQLGIDFLELINQEYQQIVDEFEEALRSELILTQSHFLSKADSIGKIAADLVLQKEFVSENWVKKNIYIKAIDASLSEDVKRKVYAYKMIRVQKLKEEVSNLLKNANGVESVETEYLEEIKSLDSLIVLFAAELGGRVIIK